jgi:hypothetical protein
MKLVGFDESGNTGEDLLNEQQPVYVLASVQVAEDDASSLLNPETRELHLSRAKRSGAGRRSILEILSSDLLSDDNVKVYVVHKSYMITGKLVDVLLEPVIREDGIDLYVDGSNVAITNLLHAVWPAFSPSGFEGLQASFVKMLRQHNKESMKDFFESVEVLGRATNHEPEFAFKALELSKGYAADEIEGLQNGTLSPELDPALTCLNALIQDWGGELGPFGVVHDESRHLTSWETMLRQWWRDTTPIEVRTWRGETLRYPANVAGLTFVNSQDSPLVQLADVVAGAVSSVVMSNLGPVMDERFTESLKDAGVLRWIVQTLWPSLDISPTDLGVQSGATPFLADALAHWLSEET